MVQGGNIATNTFPIPRLLELSNDDGAQCPGNTVTGIIQFFYSFFILDVAVSTSGTLVLCKAPFETTTWLVQGIGDNSGKTVYPESASGGNELKARPFIVGDLQQRSIHCGFDNCFAIQENNYAIVWSWYFKEMI